MDLTEEERDIALWAFENGKNPVEIMSALNRNRANKEQEVEGVAGVMGRGVGFGKQVFSDVQDLGKLIPSGLSAVNALVPGGRSPGEAFSETFQELGVSDERLEPKNEAQRQGALGARVAEVASGAGILPRLSGFVGKRLGKSGGELASRIQPKPTAAEIRRAKLDDRYKVGAESKLWGKAPDQIIPSARENQVAEAVARYVPKWDDMNNPQIITELQKTIPIISKRLEEPMREVSVGGYKVKLKNQWKLQQKVQSDDLALVLDSSKIKAGQRQFQKFIDQAQNATNLDELWKLRIAYDKSIPAFVKSADSTKSATLQAQKEMWMNNRNLFNEIIHDASNELGPSTRQGFTDMSLMYDAIQNMASQTGVRDMKGKGGLINKKNGLKWMLGFGSGAAIF